MTNEKKNLENLKAKLNELTASSGKDDMKKHLTDLRRMGKSLDPEEIKALLDCSCGPQHEDGIQPWP